MEPDPAATPFTPEVVRAVTAHMNDDHPRETLIICRALGGHPDAASARMVGLDTEGGDYRAVVGGAEVAVRIPWSRPLTERAQVRAEVVRMYRESCDLLGVSPGADPGRH
ncbi:DUF2470 domain-containing protein [Streptomonospora sp. S1-112]|uniref:DUF2470 domain-containing protein n=1 Tax=Streptomonospora mangrovi TaxID=2883123 RepID=A0A9X3NNM2_9ACTN|nr:DUF2470 domain-containing protein [Streptomonospora mangrovi]MDA0565366.1 DUF2470 domain-containing protein [Streptomonospora mangrovi]